MKKEKLFVSACLLGEKCRYDGKDNLLKCIQQLEEKYELVSLCPEVAGGLPTPRLPCERMGSQVINKNGEDKTKEFQKGALQAAAFIQQLGIKKALLQERSPSCGVYLIYDGSFSNHLIKGQGVTKQALLPLGLTIYSSEEINLLLGDE